MPTRYPKDETQRLVVDRVERGWSLRRLQGEPGFPSAALVKHWARQDPGFRVRLQRAIEWRRLRSRPAAPWSGSYDFDCAERLLARVRGGESLVRLTAESGFPYWKKLRVWRRERPEFEAALQAALAEGRAARRRRGRRWARFDPAAADKIIVRVARGETLREIAGPRSGLPCIQIIHRWRRENAEFGAAMRTVVGMGRRQRRRARRGPDAALTGAVIDAIAEGASLRELGRRADMPDGSTLWRWLRDDAAFCKAVDWASRVRDEGMVERAVGIAGAMTAGNVAGPAKQIAAIEARIARMAPRGGKRAWRAGGKEEQ
jgi:hypothetical protein